MFKKNIKIKVDKNIAVITIVATIAINAAIFIFYPLAHILCH